MTQEQRADVWTRKLALTSQHKAATDKDEAKRLKEQIEACNTELTTNTYNPPIVEAEAE